MRQKILICLCLLLVVMAGCDKDDTPNNITPNQSEQTGTEAQEDSVEVHELDCPPLYGVLIDLKSFNSGSGGAGPLWMSTPGDWDPANPGPFDPVMIKDTYRGLWTARLYGTEVSYLFPEVRAMYEQLCLEWGVRIQAYVDSSSVIANIPVNPHLPDFMAVNHGIIGLDLITERDFDDNHPAGSSLADIAEIKFFSVEPIFRNESTGPLGVVVGMKDVTATTIPRIAYGEYYVRLTRNPQKAGTYAFQEVIYTADGRVLKYRHKRVWLKEHLQEKPRQFPN